MHKGTSFIYKKISSRSKPLFFCNHCKMKRKKIFKKNTFKVRETFDCCNYIPFLKTFSKRVWFFQSFSTISTLLFSNSFFDLAYFGSVSQINLGFLQAAHPPSRTLPPRGLQFRYSNCSKIVAMILHHYWKCDK